MEVRLHAHATVGHDGRGAGPGRPLPQHLPGGRALQLDPQVGRAWFQRLKLKYDGPVSNCAFNVKLRRYMEASAMFATLEDGVTFKYPGQGRAFKPGFETKPDTEFNFEPFYAWYR